MKPKAEQHIKDERLRIKVESPQLKPSCKALWRGLVTD